MPPPKLAIGVDAGGTWVRVVALAGERCVARAKVRSQGDLPGLLKMVWHGRRWLPAERLVVAARGVWTKAERRALEASLSGFAREVHAISDVEAAHLGALGGGPGILVLAGTGSIVLGRGARGAWVREGGLGPLLGDEGSGFWIGREWLRTSASERARALGRGPTAVARIAALARGVIARARRGSRPERAIVRAGQGHLAAQAAAVAAAIGPGERLSVSWAGSVMSDAWFRRGVARALARDGVRARWSEPVEEPALAAARLAERGSRP